MVLNELFAIAALFVTLGLCKAWLPPHRKPMAIRKGHLKEGRRYGR
jgi:hypothetical protein